MRHIIGTLTAAAAGVTLALAVPAAWAAEGYLTFRDHDGDIIEHHSSPEGCYNVPRESMAEAAFADAVAILIDARDCEGAEIAELDRDLMRVFGHESVLIRERR